MMKVSDDMVEAALLAMFGHHKLAGEWADDAVIHMRRALEAALRVQAMEQLIEAGAEQMEQEAENG